MENDENLFNDEGIENLAIDNDISEDKIVDILVGEGKKYKTIADLARATVYKENHIKQLEKEAKLASEKRNESKNVEELLKALQRTNTVENKDLDRDHLENKTQEKNTTETVNQDELVSKVLSALEAKETHSKKKGNLEEVRQTLIKEWGSEYLQNLQKISTDLGLSESDANELAARSPKAFFNLFGVTKTSTDNVSPKFSNNSAGTQVNRNEKNFSYYEKIRKTDPRRYMSSEIQNEMIQQAFKLGDRFHS